jgi:predicted ATPase
MIVKMLHVKNFRSIIDECIDCDNLTVLVGRNGTGKSDIRCFLGQTRAEGCVSYRRFAGGRGVVNLSLLFFCK